MKPFDTDRIHEAVLRLAKQVAVEMQDDVMDKIRTNDSVASGVLVKSVTRSVASVPNGVVVSVGPTASYGEYVETGTRPHWPPRQAIKDWLMEKTRGQIGDGPELRTAAFLISRKISRVGTESRPYIEPVWVEYATKLPDRFANMVVKSA